MRVWQRSPMPLLSSGVERATRFVRGAIVLWVCGLLLLPVAVTAQTPDPLQELKRLNIERDRTHTTPPVEGSRAVQDVQALALPADADDDGMPDAWEAAQGLNPSDPADAWLDPDGDHVVNLFEYQLGSDPRSAATPRVVTVGPTGATYTSVATALNAVARGTVIRVSGGSYLVNYTTFSVKVVMIQGGWSPDFRQRDLRAYPTEFDGAMRAEILYFSPGSGESAVILDGLRFVRGNGHFGAVNFLADGTSVMRTSLLDCSITGSSSTAGYGSVLRLQNWNASTSDRTVANTLIAGNQASGIYSQFTDSSVARWRIINTTITANANGGRSNGYGIDVLTDGTAVLTAHVYNSILWGNAQSDIDLARNVTFDAEYSDIGRVTGTGATYRAGAGLVNTDPRFVNAAAGDFHLSASSPLVNAGINRGVPLTDWEGDPRTVGGVADIGADERLSTDREAPGAPSGLTASVSGSSIALAWTAPAVATVPAAEALDLPAGGAPTAYTIEAGSSPGLANLANFSTGNTATTFAASGIANGTYYLRARATNSAGTSGPSNEVIMVVGGGGCTVPPGAPAGLTITQNSGGTVAFRWSAAAGGPTTYILEAGSAPGLANLANSNLGGTATTFGTSGVGAGTYYVRVRAANACGTSGASNEVVLIVP